MNVLVENNTEKWGIVDYSRFKDDGVIIGLKSKRRLVRDFMKTLKAQAKPFEIGVEGVGSRIDFLEIVVSVSANGFNTCLRTKVTR